MKDSTIPVPYQVACQNNTRDSSIQVPHLVQLKQYKGQYHPSTIPSTMPKQHKGQFHLSTTPTIPKQYEGQYHSSTVTSTTPKQYEEQYHSSTMHIDSGKPSSTTHTVQNMAQSIASFRTTTPSTAMTGRTTKQVNPVHIHPETSCKAPLEHCMHVHQPTVQVCKPGESLALRKVKHPDNGRTSVSRLSLTKQDILSQYSSCFEGIGHFPGDPYKFHLKPEYKPAQYAPRKVPIHLESAFKEEIESLVKRGILEEVKEHTDWVNSYVVVEKDTGNHHSPNHTIKKKLRICLDPRDLNEALEREPYHTQSVDEIIAKFQGMTIFTIVDFKKGYWMVVLHPDSRKLTCTALPFGRFQWT